MSVVPKRAVPKAVLVRKADRCRKVAALRHVKEKIVRGPKPAVKAKAVVPKYAPHRKAADQNDAQKGVPVLTVVPAAKVRGPKPVVPVVPVFRPAGPASALLADPVDLVVLKGAVPKVVAVPIGKARRASEMEIERNSRR